MINKKKIIIGSDHAGFKHKEQLIPFLKKAGYEVVDVGTDSEESADYPDYVHPLTEYLEDRDAKWGIVICGTGNGVAMTANKHQGIRAALCWNEELASLARRHNNANILAIPARYVSLEKAEEMAKIFLETPFDGGRHKERVIKIDIRYA